tara:strand:- start:307 stop:465 length:159 start_codon:yes stop_codon:yes gene_type:complete
MLSLLLAVLFLQSFFWWLLKFPIMSFDWIVQLKFFNLFFAALFIWIISGKAK